ncbi:class III aminotransferase [Cohaesibacter celericrescens]|uniref:Class III aminotransferase n=1 Tax=Cohaesibacter celericrescens TaxID=2067669 RepID=A0A2N5XTN4_9HYPH|nr:class III aminotransferase [Cohaesibacter celericrescens]
MPALPHIMVAPNGARKGKKDHPALPITIAETVETARVCSQAGADGLHAHVRDKDGKHCLDAGLYRELLAELKIATPDIYIQITTESVGQYSPAQQRSVVQDVTPAAVSISIREMLGDGEIPEIKRFYQEQEEKGVAVQHILYDTQDVDLITKLCSDGTLPSSRLDLLFVLGRYTTGQTSSPDALHPFLQSLHALETAVGIKADWACCAFGNQETDCLLHAMQRGGKARIGFENNVYHADGSRARDNAERVTALIKSRAAMG